jgi:hypothetical protein
MEDATTPDDGSGEAVDRNLQASDPVADVQLLVWSLHCHERQRYRQGWWSEVASPFYSRKPSGSSWGRQSLRAGWTMVCRPACGASPRYPRHQARQRRGRLTSSAPADSAAQAEDEDPDEEERRAPLRRASAVPAPIDSGELRRPTRRLLCLRWLLRRCGVRRRLPPPTASRR